MKQNAPRRVQPGRPRGLFAPASRCGSKHGSRGWECAPFLIPARSSARFPAWATRCRSFSHGPQKGKGHRTFIGLEVARERGGPAGRVILSRAAWKCALFADFLAGFYIRFPPALGGQRCLFSYAGPERKLFTRDALTDLPCSFSSYPSSLFCARRDVEPGHARVGGAVGLLAASIAWQ